MLTKPPKNRKHLMQPNDPNQQTTGYPGNQPGQPPLPQPGLPPQPFNQPQQPVYAAPPQPGNFGQPPLPPAQPGMVGQPQYGTAPQPPTGSQYLNPLEPSPQQFQPLQPQPSNSGGGKKVLLMVIALIVVVALGAGGYLYATKSDSKKSPTTSLGTTKSNTAASKTPKTTGDLTKLGSFTLIAPTGAALGGMTVSAPTAANTYTVLTSSDGNCTIGFGIMSQTALPGTDLNSLIAAKITDAKKEDSSIKTTGPDVANSIVLKDAAGKTYALPTANFTITDATTGGGTISETYSAVELADKSHVIVYSTCNSDKANDQAATTTQVKALQPIVAAITVQIK